MYPLIRIDQISLIGGDEEKKDGVRPNWESLFNPPFPGPESPKLKQGLKIPELLLIYFLTCWKFRDTQ